MLKGYVFSNYNIIAPVYTIFLVSNCRDNKSIYRDNKSTI